MPESKKGKKNRKYGRTERSPSHKRYNEEQRWIKNKVRRILKQITKFPNYKPFNLSPQIQAKLNEAR
jgi:hypothetical protein